MFQSLVRDLQDHLHDEDKYHEDPNYNLHHNVLMVLWVLATPDTFRSVALRFGKTPGVLHFHYKRIIIALCEMSSRIITWPDAEERRALAQSVERRTGFPGVVGAVDGCYINILKPKIQGQRYVNRHHDHAITLQGTCDETLLFRDIYVGQPASVHDSRVFRRSPLCKRLLEDRTLLTEEEHILGDGAYILTNRVY